MYVEYTHVPFTPCLGFFTVVRAGLIFFDVAFLVVAANKNSNIAIVGGVYTVQ